MVIERERERESEFCFILKTESRKRYARSSFYVVSGSLRLCFAVGDLSVTFANNAPRAD